MDVELSRKDILKYLDKFVEEYGDTVPRNKKGQAKVQPAPKMKKPAKPAPRKKTKLGKKEEGNVKAAVRELELMPVEDIQRALVQKKIRGKTQRKSKIVEDLLGSGCMECCGIQPDEPEAIMLEGKGFGGAILGGIVGGKQRKPRKKVKRVYRQKEPRKKNAYLLLLDEIRKDYKDDFQAKYGKQWNKELVKFAAKEYKKNF